jgi:hypothetical protein
MAQHADDMQQSHLSCSIAPTTYHALCLSNEFTCSTTMDGMWHLRLLLLPPSLLAQGGELLFDCCCCWHVCSQDTVFELEQDSMNNVAAPAAAAAGMCACRTLCLSLSRTQSTMLLLLLLLLLACVLAGHCFQLRAGGYHSVAAVAAGMCACRTLFSTQSRRISTVVLLLLLLLTCVLEGHCFHLKAGDYQQRCCCCCCCCCCWHVCLQDTVFNSKQEIINSGVAATAAAAGMCACRTPCLTWSRR